MQNFYSNLATPLFENGYLPTPTNGKIPVLSGWQIIDYTAEDISLYNEKYGDHGIGLLTGRGATPLLAIDIDVDYPDIAEAITDAIFQRYGSAPTRIGRDPKILLLYTANKPFRKVKFSFKSTLNSSVQAVELLGEGQQFIAYGVHPVTKKQYRWTSDDTPENIDSFMLAEIDIEEITQWLAEILPTLIPSDWSMKINNSNYDQEIVTDEDDFMANVPKPATDFTHDQVIEMLSIQSPDCDNDEWVRIGMALKHWDEKEGLIVWDEWSKPGKTYEKGETSKRWKSFRPAVNGITLATYWKQYRNYIETQATKESETFVEKIGDCETEEQLKMIGKTIQKIKFDVFDFNKIVGAFRVKYKEIIGVSMTESDGKKLLSHKQSKNSRRVETGEVITAPEWLDGWSFITSHNKFFKMNSSELIDSQAFRISMGRFMPIGENGQRGDAVAYACHDALIPVVYGSAYHPAKESIFDIDGSLYVNTFNPSSIPNEAEQISEAGQRACDRIYNHIFKLCGGREDVTHELIDWLAFNVKFMGVKINYAVLIQGPEGIGKSFIKEMMQTVIGESNVNTISPQVVTSAFNSFSQGMSLAIFEELRIQGHNRYDVVNAIKPLITDDTIMVHKKGKDAYKAKNVTNYIAFTNFKDAIPINESDRRWFVIFAPWNTIAEFEADVGVHEKEYFEELFSILKPHGEEIRRWFLDWQIGKDFKATGRAPITFDKMAMANTSHGTEENHIIKQVIESGGMGVSSEVVATKYLYETIHDTHIAEQFDGAHLDIRTGTVNQALKELGFVRFMKTVRWNGEVLRVWVKKSSIDSVEEIKELLDKTIDVF